MKVVLAYLLIGSYGLLFREWRSRAPSGTTVQETES